MFESHPIYPCLHRLDGFPVQTERDQFLGGQPGLEKTVQEIIGVFLLPRLDSVDIIRLNFYRHLEPLIPGATVPQITISPKSIIQIIDHEGSGHDRNVGRPWENAGVKGIASAILSELSQSS